MRALAAFACLMLVTACQTAPPEGLTAADQEAIYELGQDTKLLPWPGTGRHGPILWTTDAVYRSP